MFFESVIFTSTGFQVDRFPTEEEAKRYVLARFEREGTKFFGELELNKEYFDKFHNKLIIQLKDGEMPLERVYWEDNSMACFS